MKKTGKILAAVGLVLAMSLPLTACNTLTAGLSDLTGGTIDGKAYMQGQMDEMYLGKFDPDYLEMVSITEEEAQETYDSNAETESEAFISAYGIEYPTDEFRTRLAGLYKQIYAKADYTVVSAAEQEDGSYSVKVTVRPLDIIQLVDAAYPAFSEEFEAKYADKDTEAMTDEEYNTWNETVYDVDYQNGLADLLESLIPTMGTMEEKSIAVQIEKDPTDGYYSINDESFTNLDALIIDYTTAE